MKIFSPLFNTNAKPKSQSQTQSQNIPTNNSICQTCGNEITSDLSCSICSMNIKSKYRDIDHSTSIYKQLGKMRLNDKKHDLSEKEYALLSIKLQHHDNKLYEAEIIVPDNNRLESLIDEFNRSLSSMTTDNLSDIQDSSKQTKDKSPQNLKGAIKHTPSKNDNATSSSKDTKSPYDIQVNNNDYIDDLSFESQKKVVYNESTANAGVVGGERVIPNIDNSAVYRDKVVKNANFNGPKQIPVVDKIPVSNLRSISDSGGSRVNQDSKKKLYDLQGYEKSVLIDPNRHLYTDAKEEKSTVSSTTVESMGIPYESVNMAAKIRNIHKSGGERVKEMDHFVATVQTPVVKLQLKNGELAKRENDIGKILQQTVKFTKLEASKAMTISSMSETSKVTVLIGSEYLTQDTSDKSCISREKSILEYCKLFDWILFHSYDILQLEYSQKTCQIYYLPTIRANEFVCSYSVSESKMYLNCMAFQQSNSFEYELSTEVDGTDSTVKQHAVDLRIPRSVSPEKLYEMLTYWVCRISLCLNHPGLYNKSVRSRLQHKLTELKYSSKHFNDADSKSLMTDSQRTVNIQSSSAVFSNGITNNFMPCIGSKYISNEIMMLREYVDPSQWTDDLLEFILKQSNNDVNMAIDTIYNIGDPSIIRSALIDEK